MDEAADVAAVKRARGDEQAPGGDEEAGAAAESEPGAAAAAMKPKAHPSVLAAAAKAQAALQAADDRKPYGPSHKKGYPANRGKNNKNDNTQLAGAVATVVSTAAST